MGPKVNNNNIQGKSSHECVYTIMYYEYYCK